ncbi:MAG TPA: hypothetical protein ENN13_02735 [Candidatus Altiarchaeales archaeon]|nr:hypothetical protein [Candidatus Altiarchaeales archaeon]
MNGGDLTERFVESIKWIREIFLPMDDIANPVMGIREWDDSVCIEFCGRLLASCDGPYTKRLVMKSALVHAATDVVVKGGKPLFALDCVIGGRPDVEEMIDSLNIQALSLDIPILGGNTLFEDVEPRASLTVVGELLLDAPIRDSTAVSGDLIALLGEPVWGERVERLEIAKRMFEAWFKIIEEVEINSSKDVTKGGLSSCIAEMEEKSGKKFKLIGNIPYPLGRNLDNFLVTLSEKEFEKLKEVCGENKCRLEKIGFVE